MKATMFRMILAAGLLTCFMLAGCASHHTSPPAQPPPKIVTDDPQPPKIVVRDEAPFSCQLIVSQNDTARTLTAFGMSHGSELEVGKCTAVPECAWTYTSNRMLVSCRDTRLALNAWNGAKDGGELRLHQGCTPSNPDCTWTWKNGMLVSDRDPNLAIEMFMNPFGVMMVRLSNMCSPATMPCRWFMR